MSFKMQQFKCNKCGHEFEELLDSRTPDQVVQCPNVVNEFDSMSCASTDVVTILAVGSGKGGHISWSKWRVSV